MENKLNDKKPEFNGFHAFIFIVLIIGFIVITYYQAFWGPDGEYGLIGDRQAVTLGYKDNTEGRGLLRLALIAGPIYLIYLWLKPKK